MSINYYRKTVLSSKRTESISLHFCNQRKRYVSNQRIRCVQSKEEYRLDISTSTNTNYKRAPTPQNLSVKQIKIWLVRLPMGLASTSKTGVPPLVNHSATESSHQGRESEKQTKDNGIMSLHCTIQNQLPSLLV